MMKTPTAEEFLKSKDYNISDDGELYDGLLTNNVIKDIIEFARLHCEAQAKIIAEKQKGNWYNREFINGSIMSNTSIMPKESILNAYPLENIK